MGLKILLLIVLSIIILVLFNFLIKTIFRIKDLIKNGPPSATGMYYDTELGSINGEVDNRGKFICDCCQKRFKTPKELKVHLRTKKIKKIWHT